MHAHGEANRPTVKLAARNAHSLYCQTDSQKEGAVGSSCGPKKNMPFLRTTSLGVVAAAEEVKNSDLLQKCWRSTIIHRSATMHFQISCTQRSEVLGSTFTSGPARPHLLVAAIGDGISDLKTKSGLRK